MKRKTTGMVQLKGRPLGELVPMPHGGALRAGGTNKGGMGRPPAALRIKSRAAFERLLDELEQRDLSLLTATELSQLANTTGRLGGLASDDEQPEAVTIRIVRDPPPDFAKAVPRVLAPSVSSEPVIGQLLPAQSHSPSKRY